MMDRKPFGVDGLPADLVDLHEDLEQIDIAERPSFAAELREELVQEYSSGVNRSRRTPVFNRAAAAAVLLIGAGLTYSPARGALVRLIQGSAAPTAAVTAEQQEEGQFEPLLASQGLEKPALTMDPQPMEALPDWSSAGPSTFPELLDREAAQRIVLDEFPKDLLDLGVGGSVRVNLWVRPDGAVEHPTVGRSSGIPDLDMAALRASRTLKFRPAIRAGRPVGTWVEFDIEFRPESRQALGEANQLGGIP